MKNYLIYFKFVKEDKGIEADIAIGLEEKINSKNIEKVREILRKEHELKKEEDLVICNIMELDSQEEQSVNTITDFLNKEKKKEFEEYIKTELCPQEFGLKGYEGTKCKSEDFNVCKECWDNAIKLYKEEE